MNDLNDLTQCLEQAPFDEKQFRRLGQSLAGMTKLADEMEAKFNHGDLRMAGNNKVQQSLQTFAQNRQLRSLSQARYICFSLSQPFPGVDDGIVADTRLFHSLLDERHGVGQWCDRPRAFKRCYRGLMSSYFEFYGLDKSVRLQTRKNWIELRDYLHAKNGLIRYESSNPRWVETALTYPSLFSENPENYLVDAADRGDHKLLNQVFEDLLIDPDSWFRQRLLLAQVRAAVKNPDQPFVKSIPDLLRIVVGSGLVRDEALALILDRYLECEDTTEHKQLRDTAVEWWGNPWLPSQKEHWGRVKKHVRNHVAQWLHKEFIEAFFSKFASGDLGDARRARFWSRYLGLFSDMRFGLGENVLHSDDEDLHVLLKKMKGLYTPLRSPAGDQNAFIMTLGNLVVVEFSNFSNALYAYDKNDIPFDYDQSLRMPVDAPNSLKQSRPYSLFKLTHTGGYTDWEDKFADRIEQRTGIVWDAPRGSSDPLNTQVHSEPEVMPESEVLQMMHDEYGLAVEDLRHKGGNLWVRTDDRDPAVNGVLKSCDFEYRQGKGWWKSHGDGH